MRPIGKISNYPRPGITATGPATARYRGIVEREGAATWSAQ
jgi:hypothetical protein